MFCPSERLTNRLSKRIIILSANYKEAFRVANQKSVLFTTSYILALAVSFFIQLSNNMLYSTIGIYAKGFTSLEYYIGLATSGFTFAALFTKLFTGKIFDFFSSRKILFAGLTLSFAASLGYLFIDNIHLLIGVRILHGLGFGISGVAISTIIANLSPHDRLLESVGYNMMLTTLTTAIGPGIVLNITHSDAAQFMPIFFLLIVLAALCLCASLPIKSEARVDDVTDCVGRLNINMATILLALLVFFIAFAQSSIVAYINLYALEADFGNMTPYFVAFAITNFSVRFFMNHILKYLSQRALLYLAGIISCGVYFGIAHAPSAHIIYILGFFFGFAMGVFYPIANTKILHSMSWHRQGMANSIYMAAVDGANAVGVMSWSAIATHFGGYNHIYSAALIVIALYLILLTVYPLILKWRHIPETSEC